MSLSRSALSSLIQRLGAILLSLTMTANFAVAQAPTTNSPQYDVELVIFRQVNPTGDNENWTVQLGGDITQTNAPSNEAAPEAPLPNSLPPITDVVALDASRFKLSAINNALQRSKSYQPIAHLGWTQPGFALDATPSTSLGRLLSDTVVSGSASLARGRYLHLTLNLVYETQDGKRYVLKQQRRMRSGEKHYFDHPYFGVIALITPRS